MSRFRARTLPDALRSAADADPDRLAFRFVAGDHVVDSVTTKALLTRARGVAAALAEHAPAGARAVLVYPPGLDFVAAFFGCQLAGMVPVPVHPPDQVRPARTLRRISAIVADAAPAVLLTTEAIRGMQSAMATVAPELGVPRWLATDHLDGATDGEHAERTTDEIAFLQYTSGSTAQPRGVVISHDNVLANVDMISRAWRLEATTATASWLPLFHDMGLIGHVLLPVAIRCESTLLSPVEFLQQPLSWLRVLSRFEIEMSGCPNFGFDLVARKVAESDLAGLDLRRWRIAYNGAEPVRAATLDRFAAALAPTGFRRGALTPCYGLAEATLFVSGEPAAGGPVAQALDGDALAGGRVRKTDPDRLGARTLVASGAVAHGLEIAIVDPDSRVRASNDQIGEIWVRGPSVARGYAGPPDQTRETFAGRIAITGESPFLRTGDLGFLHDGKLFIVGRCKDLMIIAGRNIYPQDIELSAEVSHPALRRSCCAAFSYEAADEERIAVVIELQKDSAAEPAAVAEAICAAVINQHDIPLHHVVLLRAGSIPKTSSGKIQRSACRAAFLDGSLDQVHTTEHARAAAEAPAGLDRAALREMSPDQATRALEAYLCTAVAMLTRRALSSIDPGLAIERIGLDSLTAADLALTVQQNLGTPVFISDVFQSTSLRQLAERLAVIARRAP